MSKNNPTPIFLILLIATNCYGINHFSDNGCDAGLCGLYLVVYTIPLIIGWILSLYGVILILKNNFKNIIFGVMITSVSIFIAKLLLPLGDGTRMDSLKVPVKILMFVDLGVILIALGSTLILIKEKLNS